MTEPDAQKQKVISYSVDVYITLALISLFAYLSLQFIAPFVSIILWSIILAVAIYPLHLKLREKLGGKNGLAAGILGICGLLIVMVPAFFVVDSMVDTLGHWSKLLLSGEFRTPPPRESVKEWPLIGERLYALWSNAYVDLEDTLRDFAPQLEGVALFLLKAGGGLVFGIAEFAFSVILAALMLGYAEPLGKATSDIAQRIATTRGRAFVDMAGATIRNVSRGILGVAVIQGGLASIGILLAGLPLAGFLSAATVAACIVQVPILVIVPTILYAWYAEPTTTAIIFTVYMIPVLFIDNFLKPILMARGLQTPMIVILIGVIGGTLASGLMGLFIGPVVLALFYEMILTWLGIQDANIDADTPLSDESAAE